jgi:two-component system alkaline phosphatase synthesis response regulator PhoP
MNREPYRILIVDDEKDVAEFLSYNLRREGYDVESAFNGRQAIEVAGSFRPHLILLDVMMPVMDGIEACNELRKDNRFGNTIIVFLTARGEDYSQIAGFEAGGDDYITKPIRPRVLLSRLKALLRRHRDEATDSPSLISLDDLVINKDKYVVTRGGQDITLPRKEFELLYILASKPNKVFTRDEIFALVWGNNIIVGDRTIDVHIRRIREKLGIENIKTVKGVGYKFET